jgi:hypothetical protein
MSVGRKLMNTQETIAFLKREIEIHERLIKQEQRNIRNMPKRSDVWLKDYQETLSKLKDELKELTSKDIL